VSETARCTICGNELTDELTTAGSPYCAACAIESAERNLPAEDSNVAHPASDNAEVNIARKSKRLRFVLAIALVVFGLAVVFAWPRLTALASIDRPLREGVLDTDATTDTCIENLWTLANQVQETGTADKTITCPASGAPYVTTGSKVAPVIECPNPGEHGLNSLSIAVRDGVPRAER
jgi:hypothetical protein